MFQELFAKYENIAARLEEAATKMEEGLEKQMLLKHVQEINEIMRLWQKSWRQEGMEITRAEANNANHTVTRSNAHHGASTFAQQAIEQFHRRLHEMSQQRLLSTTGEIAQLVQDIHQVSIDDMRYGDTYSLYHMNAPFWRCAKEFAGQRTFLGPVPPWKTIDRSVVAWDSTGDTFVFATSMAITLALKSEVRGTADVTNDDNIITRGTIHVNVRNFLDRLGGTERTKWKLRLQFERLRADPSRLAQSMENPPKPSWRRCTHIFDDLVLLSKYFHVFTPMDDPGLVKAHFLRLRNQHVGMMPLDEILLLGKEGCMQCSCEKYKHYGICYHSVGDALRKGIILDLHGLGTSNPALMRGHMGSGGQVGGGGRKSSGSSLQMQAVGIGFRDITKGATF